MLEVMLDVKFYATCPSAGRGGVIGYSLNFWVGMHFATDTKIPYPIPNSSSVNPQF